MAVEYGGMRKFSVAERRARIGLRHHLSPAHRAATVEAACEGMVCLHATDPATVYLSAWARVDGLAVADVDRALYAGRSLVKHLAMRRTLFVVPRALLGVVQTAASQRVADQERRRLVADVERAGVATDGLAWLEAACEAALDALGALGEATSSQLRKAAPVLDASVVYAPDKTYGGNQSLAPRVLTVLSASGLVLRGSNAGGWTTSRPRWATTAHWLGTDPPPRPPEREARAELVRRWLHTFGPATPADVKWWLGSTVTAVRQALADVGAVEIDLDGVGGVALPDDLDEAPAPAPWAALLPGLDPTTMGWQSRHWYLGPHGPALFDTNGNAGPTAWWDGRVVGGWTQDEGGEVVVQLLEDPGAEGRAALEGEAARLSAWLGGVRIPPRFPSPLSKTKPGAR